MTTSLEDRHKQNKELSKTFHRKRQGTLLSFDEIDETITSALETQIKQQAFLQEAADNPNILWKGLRYSIPSTSSLIFSLMEKHYREKESDRRLYTPHHLLVYLASLLNRDFQEWLTTRDIQESFSILVRDAHTFPSIFAVYHGETELIQFNPFQSYYGARMPALTHEELEASFQKRISQLEGEIEHFKAKLTEIEKINKNPLLTAVKSPRFLNNILVLFFKRKSLYRNIKKEKKQAKQRITYYQKELEQEITNQPKRIQDQNEKERLLNLLFPFFNELEYELTTEKNRLY